MFETFLNWIKLKFQIHYKINRPTFKEKEVWWSNFGQNVGDEENGKDEFFMRPVLVIKKFNNHLALVVPTSRQLKNNQFYIQIGYKNQLYSALISHLRTIDVKRFRKKIAKFDDMDFENVVNGLQRILPKN